MAEVCHGDFHDRKVTGSNPRDMKDLIRWCLETTTEVFLGISAGRQSPLAGI